MENFWHSRTQNTDAVNLKIFGMLSSHNFQHAKHLAKMFHRNQPSKYKKPQYREMMEFDWHEYKYKLCQNIGGQAWALINDVAVFWNDELLGNNNNLFDRLANSNYFLDNIPDQMGFSDVIKKARENYFNKDSDRAFTFFEIGENEKSMGTLLFELYSDLLPKTCERFMDLCINHPLKMPKFTYTGSNLHRIAKSGWLQGGDIGWENCKYYPDECYAVGHDQRGILSLANCGKDTNATQFFINFNPAPWMDGYFVAIGRIIEGHSLLERLENSKTYYERPFTDLKVINSGVLPYGKGKAVRERFIDKTVEQIREQFRTSIRQQDLTLLQNKLDNISKSHMVEHTISDKAVTGIIKFFRETSTEEEHPDSAQQTMLERISSETGEKEKYPDSALETKRISSETGEKEKYSDSALETERISIETGGEEKYSDSSLQTKRISSETGEKYKYSDSALETKRISSKTGGKEEHSDSALKTERISSETGEKDKYSDSALETKRISSEPGGKEKHSDSSLKIKRISIETDEKEKYSDSSLQTQRISSETGEKEKYLDSALKTERSSSETGEKDIHSDSALKIERISSKTGGDHQYSMDILEGQPNKQDSILEKILHDLFMTTALHEIHPDTLYPDHVSSSELLNERYDLGLYSEPILKASLLRDFLEICYDEGFLERPPCEIETISSSTVESPGVSEQSKSDTTIASILEVIMRHVNDACGLSQSYKDVELIIEQLLYDVTDLPIILQKEAAVRNQVIEFIKNIFMTAMETFWIERRV